MKLRYLLILLLMQSCYYNNSEIKVMSYNVQNLFDDRTDGTEYYEFNPTYGKWGSDQFNNKLRAISQVIIESDADIVAFSEIENRYCIDMLVQYYLQGRGYLYNFCPDQESSSVNCALISRIPITDISCHNVYNEDVFLRYIVEVEIDNKFKLFVNHWKSRLGGVAFTTKFRQLSAAVLEEQLRLEDGFWIALGDFNAEPEEVLSFFGGDLDVANFWDAAPSDGSYIYNDKWEKIDGIYYSGEHSSYGVEIIDSYVETHDYLFNKDGSIASFYAKSGTGYSDHLPLIFSFRI